MQDNTEPFNLANSNNYITLEEVRKNKKRAQGGVFVEDLISNLNKEKEELESIAIIKKYKNGDVSCSWSTMSLTDLGALSNQLQAWFHNEHFLTFYERT